MSELPEPLVAAHVNLHGFAGFMLNVDRLLASELLAIGTPEECWAALMLWCRAWQQVPAGSLPDDDRILAAFSRAGARWPKVRDVALRGFIKCSDGRLYHRVLAYEVNRAWKKRRQYESDQDRLRLWREKKRQERETHFNGTSNGVSKPIRNSSTTTETERDPPPIVPPLKRSKRISPTELTADERRDFEEWWKHYPVHEGKKEAEIPFRKALAKATLADLIAGADQYAARLKLPNAPSPKWPQGWLNTERWTDELPGLERPQEEWERMGMGSPGFG